MRRRGFLVALAALSGCGGIADDGERSPETLTPAPVPSVTEPPAETPPRRAGRFRGVPCPDLVESLPRTCSHTAPEEVALVLVPDPVAVGAADGAPVRPVRLTLRASLTEPVTVYADGWRLYRHESPGGPRPVQSDPADRPWTHVAGDLARAGERTVAPDERHHWALGLAESDSDAVTGVTARIDPGVHAFVVVVRGEYSTIQWACVGVFEALPAGEAGPN